MVGAATCLPTELLINEHGVLIDILRAQNAVESMTMDRISHFLLFGTRLPDVKGNNNTKRRVSMPLRWMKNQRSTVEDADGLINDGIKKKRHTSFKRRNNMQHL
eukprot:scaffold154906_cov23-Cyclotella_meneghiniana.AAC.1